MRVVNGQLVEGWGERDRLGVLQELGVVPSQEEIMARLASLA